MGQTLEWWPTLSCQGLLGERTAGRTACPSPRSSPQRPGLCFIPPPPKPKARLWVGQSGACGPWAPTSLSVQEGRGVAEAWPPRLSKGPGATLSPQHPGPQSLSPAAPHFHWACEPPNPPLASRPRKEASPSPRDLPVIKAAVSSPPWGPAGGESWRGKQNVSLFMF